MSADQQPEPGYSTIDALLAEGAARWPDSPFAIFADETIDYVDMDARARAVARGLIALGVKPGTHVGLLMPTCSAWLEAYFGVLYAGGIVVALNARYKKHELAYTVEHSDIEWLLTTDAIADHVDFEELLVETFPGIAEATDPHRLNLTEAPRLRGIVMFGEPRRPTLLSAATLLAAGDAVDPGLVDEYRGGVAAEGVAVLMYTSGTTSNPKACALTHAGIGRSWRTFAETVSLKQGEKVWLPMPFFHTGGIGPMMAIMWRGAALVAQTHFEPEAIVALIRRHRVAHLYSGFPQFSMTVLQHPSYDRETFGFIRSMLNVGPPAMQHQIQAMLPEGATLLNLFGMTEGSGIVTFTPWDCPLELRATSSGRAPAHTDVRVCDPDTNLPVPSDTPGEIQFRGGGALAYYYKDPRATEQTIVEGGWVRTGDRGRLDEAGWLFYLGRLKDMLKVGGENVAASEIEFFLNQHDGVKMVQVIGVPDARLTEVPIAFVERNPGQDVSAEELVAMCQGQLAKWKIPREIVFVTEWPMSSTKVQKFRLRELVADRF